MYSNRVNTGDTNTACLERRIFSLKESQKIRKSRYTESQIVKILKEVEGGRLVKEVCREYSVSDATYYNWKALGERQMSSTFAPASCSRMAPIICSSV
jgi:transposase-like protein